MTNDRRSTIDIFEKDVPRSDELPIMVIHRAGIGELLARQAMAWCRSWLQTFPIKITLNNVGLLTVLLAIVSPRFLIYTILYPIFRLVFGTLYPAYASYKAVRTKNVKEYVKWMMYWIVFALFTCAETFTDVFFSFWFPFYYEIKIILVLWLLSPATKGSSILYRRFVHPALIRREAEIDEALARATEQGYTAVLHLGTKGVNYATTVLMQTAIKNLPIVLPPTTSALPDRQSDPAISSLANPRTRTQLNSQLDGPDYPDGTAACNTLHVKSEDLIGDTDAVDWRYQESTTDDDEEMIQELPTMDAECEMLEEQQPVVFKVPEKEAPRKTRKSRKECSSTTSTKVSRRQKTRACKSTTKNYDMEFSDDAEGGGGLVQQLRKSYSLSDLTGEKEDENRNTPDARDETDMEVEPRRREHVGRRGYSPRRTQSSSNASRVEMYFSEVDVDVRQPRPREPIASLTNIRSSDDISSGYSSGEALQSQRTTSQGDSLVRTSSVGARTRVKPRSTAKKTPEDRGEDFDCTPPENISLPSSLNVLTPEQAVELLLLLSQSNNKSINYPTSIITYIDSDKSANENRSAMKTDDNESSSTESSGEFVDTDSAQIDVQTVQTIEIKNISTENLSIPAVTKSADKINIDSSIKRFDIPQSESNAQMEYIDDEPKKDQVVLAVSQKSEIGGADLERITGEICQQKFDELKQLLDDAHKAVTGIVSSQEKLNTINRDKEHVNVREIKTGDSSSICDRDIVAQPPVTPSTSSYDLDGDNRAGKYHKKPAPKAPISNETVISNEDIDENESQNALKATLVIKTGTLRTVSSADATKDIFLAHTSDTKKRKKKSSKLRAKESISKLLTIPKNIFHSAFHREQNETSSKEEDSSSTHSETSGSASRSDSIGSQVFVDASAKLSTSKQEMDVEEIPLRPEHDNNIKNSDKDMNFFAKKLDTEIVPLNEIEIDLKIEDNKKEEGAISAEKSENHEKNIEHEPNLQIHNEFRYLTSQANDFTSYAHERLTHKSYDYFKFIVCGNVNGLLLILRVGSTHSSRSRKKNVANAFDTPRDV
ncbi:Receptor expression-enhancing protein 1 [Temnothorax longispinosus]|uniref:Receptor expression-enhancing protein 1 n=1 Tax=Temnothorax longispinosus TaxID=300112 RepID=A0A4S2KKE4_9HYME|nr:Receptor expression-enhancing protein 1 [Temnothorax longispinosus]